MPQNITFLGAAETVTGSRHLLTLNGHRVLVDCGLFQGSRELSQRNWEPFPVDPSTIECVVLTHAHTDHIGFLPRFLKQGFTGPIYATPATIGLCKVSLPDSGRIQEEDAHFHNRHGSSQHQPAEPLYTEADAYEVLKKMVPVHYFQGHELPGKAQFRYLPAGHILGSAFAEIYFENGERILMSGDLGRYDQPIIADPTTVDFAEYLTIESTYGDRVHAKTDPKEALLEIMQEAERNKSVVLFASFAIGRTQDLLWYLHQLKDEGRLPGFPIYVDSPMATAATTLYANAQEDHDVAYQKEIAQGHLPLGGDLVKFIRDRNMSKSLNSAKGPYAIIAGSGMMNGGRILHHLQAHGGNPDTTLVFTGYQASGTLGRRLAEGDRDVHLFGHEMRINAQIRQLDMMSAHADSDEIMRWLGGFKTPPKQTFIVHGEPPAQAALKARIEKELGWKALIPVQGQSVDL